MLYFNAGDKGRGGLEDLSFAQYAAKLSVAEVERGPAPEPAGSRGGAAGRPAPGPVNVMTEIKIQRVAVTGARGFLGRHLLDRLHREPGLSRPW